MHENLPKVAMLRSIKVEVKEGEIYYYCTCGLSETQPFCDGSHQETEFSPLEYKAQDNAIISFCGCKHTKKPPFCDGAHKTLA